MMKTEQAKKVIIKIEPEVQQENLKNARKGLKTLQHTAVDKENFAGRAIIHKDHKSNLISNIESKKEKPVFMHKGTQTEKYLTNIDDLTGDEPSADYWKRLAEKRQESLDESLQEIEKLKENIEALQEENKICKEMLEESKNLVEVLQEMINEGENEDTPEEERSEDSADKNRTE